VGTVVWDKEFAELYDTVYAGKSDRGVLDPIVDFLAELADDGPALEFAIGTGRVALPLAARGLRVAGIELSPHMADQLARKPGADAVEVTVGDMASVAVPGAYRLVYLVANTIMNVTTQDEQVAVFTNAAAHLEAGGVFVLEVIVPPLRSVPPEELGRVFSLEDSHVGIDTFDDPLGQVSWSHHWFEVGGRWVRHSAPYRYLWPPEMDLMARIAGLRVRERWADWVRTPFDTTSTSQVVVYEKPVAIGAPEPAPEALQSTPDTLLGISSGARPPGAAPRGESPVGFLRR
jgi:SAM-dependent methyltransferase